MLSQKLLLQVRFVIFDLVKDTAYFSLSSSFLDASKRDLHNNHTSS